MSADDEKTELLNIIEHDTTLDRPNFEHFSVGDLGKIVDLYDTRLNSEVHPITEAAIEADGKRATVTMTRAALDHVVNKAIERTVPVAIETAAEYHDALRDFEAAEPTETDGYPLNPDVICDEANKGRANANPRYIQDGGRAPTDLSAVERVNGAYPLSPELVSEAVDQLRHEGREADARRMIADHPSLYAVAQSGESHEELDPARIRANATGEAIEDDLMDWDDDADLEKLAPKHEWLDRSEWDTDDLDDLDGDE